MENVRLKIGKQTLDYMRTSVDDPWQQDMFEDIQQVVNTVIGFGVRIYEDPLFEYIHNKRQRDIVLRNTK